ncbi:MAG: hypothetical protein CMC96_03165 [Flavobacteriales bacterium]|nr:hypothetical protein [Flavobacteriales bacterium]|tara:strand:- start:8395 stop:9123 length:729 start_codon:yes stop_codon:yes gene_type:complete
MKKLNYIALPFIFSGLIACSELNQIVNELPTTMEQTSEPSTFEMGEGLKAALEKGTIQGVVDLAKGGGYLSNEAYKIYFPPSAQKVENTLRDLGFNDEVDRLVVSLNKAAENAVSEAKPLFIEAIRGMSIADAKGILFGADTAATNYLKRKTAAQLHQKFEPKIQASLNEVNATKYWADIMTQYNKIPLVEKVETNLSRYVTERAVDGLFLKIAEEEKAIRENPQQRTTDLLKKVFGYADEK